MGTDLVVQEQPVVTAIDRAWQIQKELVNIKKDLETRFFNICELLTEVKDSNYHNVYGFTTFADWVEQGSELDMSARQAFYYINIYRKIEKLGLGKNIVSSIGVTKLKEILSLPVEQEADIKGLLSSAPDTTVAEVKTQVAKAKAKNGEEPVEYVTFRLDPGVKAMVDKAFKLARLVYGEDVIEGDAVEPTHSKCMELICLAYTQDPENYPEGMSEHAL